MSLSPDQIETLYVERCKIETFLTPIDKTPEQLAKEAVIANWKQKAIDRLTVIDELLSNEFFPNPKDEGIQRTETDDYFAAIKPALKREFDVAAIKPVIAKLPSGFEETLIKYKPQLVLDEYRSLTEKQKKIFDQCLVITPAKTTFEIVKKQSENE